MEAEIIALITIKGNFLNWEKIDEYMFSAIYLPVAIEVYWRFYRNLKERTERIVMFI